MTVRALGYLGLTTKSPIGQWTKFAGEVLGAATRVTPSGLQIRLDEHIYRIEVEETKEDALKYVGWDLGSEEALNALHTKLLGAGIDVVRGDAEACLARGVLGLLCFDDPAGIALELFYGRMAPTEPFVSPVGTKFVTGSLGLGHVVFRVPNYDATLQFYREILGFRITDVWRGDSGSAVFMHCNSRHHSLALRDGVTSPELIHFMVEVDSVDSVGLASDRGHDVISRTLGRHFNDQMLSCYFKTPSGFEVEYGTGGRLVDDDNWLVGQIDQPSGWGHKRR